MTDHPTVAEQAAARVSLYDFVKTHWLDVQAPVFSHHELRIMTEAAAIAKAKASPAPPKNTTARKRWETPAAYAKRMRKQR